jgi:ankyrin repeat protein|eukprot:scaffold349_cov267-Chaetoceros_neogracile.AAC.45
MFAFSQEQQDSGEIDSSTPFIAASDGDLALLQQSLRHLSVPATVTDTNGITPLHSAASYNQIEVMRWLFNQNVNVNAKDNDGDAPIHHCDTMSAAKILMEEGKADYKITNNEGKTVVQVKEEELKESGKAMEEEDSDDEDMKALDELVGYLKSLPQ